MEQRQDFLYTKHVGFIKNIHRFSQKKMDDFQELLGVEFTEIDAYQLLKKITRITMIISNKKDLCFFYWLFYVGHYIKLKNNGGKWILIKRPSKVADFYFIPYMISDTNDVWAVGDFCYSTFYTKGKLGNVSFETFYKLNIDRAIRKFKLQNLNIKEEYITYLE